MIITIDHIKAMRPLSDNISEKRLYPYIDETERLDVMSAFGPEIYYKIEQSVLTDNEEHPITSNTGELITFTHLGDYDILLVGGYYECNGVKKYLSGLIKAESYIAYSRMLMNQQVNVTAFGVGTKNSEFSSPVTDKTLVRASTEAEKIGKIYLQECVQYLLDTNEIPRKKNVYKRKFKAIG